MNDTIPATSQPHGLPRSGTSLARLLFDRDIPALLFGFVALMRFLNLLEQARQGPAESSVEAWLVYLLNLSHHALTVMFLGLVVTLFLVRHAPRGGRAGPLPMVIALLGSFIMSIALSQSPTTDDWRILALADFLMASGLAFTIYGAGALRYCFGIAPEARGLVMTGAYRLVRHPLYLGEFVTLFGGLLPVLAPFTIGIFVAFCALQATRAAMEERVLSATFPEYAAYRRRTPALLPWPRPR